MQPPEIDLTQLDAIIERHKIGKWELIPLLQDVQETFGYVPPETIEPIAAALTGTALGIGYELPLACHRIFAAAGTRGRPGMVMMSPVLATTKWQSSLSQ